MNNHFHVPVTIMEQGRAQILTSALLDSGATTTFISKKLTEKAGLTITKFPIPIPLLNIDGTSNNAGKVTHYTTLQLAIGQHKTTTQFAITDIDDQDVIIGIDWLRNHNPHINWRQGTITLHCCRHKNNPITIHRTTPPADQPLEQIKANMHKGVEFRILAGMSKSQELAIKAKDNQIKSLEEMVPKEYLDYRDIFSKEKSNRLPEHKPWDLEINIKEGQELPKPRKAFPMAPAELTALKEFITQERKLGRIRPSQSETSAPMFFIKKKDGGLRFVQDYRNLNNVTIKNRYPIPLTSELIDQLREAKYFTHLDLRNGYNNIRIKKGHEYKLAFQTPIGLFEPLVMYFGMSNAPGAFQALMNEIFKDMIIPCLIVVYLDDILIFSRTKEEHVRDV